MAVANTKTFGLADQFIQDNKQKLKDKGLDVTDWITETSDMKSDAVMQAAKQDDMDTAAKAQTKIAQASSKTLYNTVSSRIDAAMSVLGKNTPEAKQLGSMRSNLIRQPKPRAVSKPREIIGDDSK